MGVVHIILVSVLESTLHGALRDEYFIGSPSYNADECAK